MPRPEIVLIAALAEKNRVIGRGLELPWHISEDLQHFKQLTLGRPLVMGRRTFESLIHQFKRPLPNRRNIVLTRRGPVPGYTDIETYPSIEAVLEALKSEPSVCIGGGSEVYAKFLPLADRLELTLVEGDYEGDAFFPPFEHLVGREFEIEDERPREGYRFVTYRRIRG
jgi:dihydrofolate reductase